MPIASTQDLFPELQSYASSCLLDEQYYLDGSQILLVNKIYFQSELNPFLLYHSIVQATPLPLP